MAIFQGLMTYDSGQLSLLPLVVPLVNKHVDCGWQVAGKTV